MLAVADSHCLYASLVCSVNRQTSVFKYETESNIDCEPIKTLFCVQIFFEQEDGKMY